MLFELASKGDWFGLVSVVKGLFKEGHAFLGIFFFFEFAMTCKRKHDLPYLQFPIWKSLHTCFSFDFFCSRPARCFSRWRNVQSLREQPWGELWKVQIFLGFCGATSNIFLPWNCIVRVCKIFFAVLELKNVAWAMNDSAWLLLDFILRTYMLRIFALNFFWKKVLIPMGPSTLSVGRYRTFTWQGSSISVVFLPDIVWNAVRSEDSFKESKCETFFQ